MDRSAPIADAGRWCTEYVLIKPLLPSWVDVDDAMADGPDIARVRCRWRRSRPEPGMSVGRDPLPVCARTPGSRPSVGKISSRDRSTLG